MWHAAKQEIRTFAEFIGLPGFIMKSSFNALYPDQNQGKARNHLAASPNVYARRLPESPMSAAQLRDHTRPEDMDAARSQGRFREGGGLRAMAGPLAGRMGIPRQEVTHRGTQSDQSSTAQVMFNYGIRYECTPFSLRRSVKETLLTSCRVRC